MKFRSVFRQWIFPLGLALSLVSLAGAEVDATRMSTKELAEKLGKSDVVVIDVRTEYDWKTATKKIAGAVRQDPDKAEAWAPTLPKDKTFVLYCS